MGEKRKQTAQSPQTAAREPWYDFKAEADGDTAEIHIYGPIGGGFFFDEDAVTGKAIVEELDELPENIKTIRVLVNSLGGSVFEAIHIANALRRQRDELGRNVEVTIEAIAASAATIITSAGNPIRIPENALMMVHNPYGDVLGDSKEMRSVADILDKIRNTIIATYRWVSKLTAAKLGKLMEDVTWMNAAEAVENGFATEVSKPIKVQASINPETLSELGEIPDKYRERVWALVNIAQNDGNDGGVQTSAKKGEGKMKPDKPVTTSSTPIEPGPQAPTEPDPQVTAEAKAAGAKAEQERLLAIQALEKTMIAAGLDTKETHEIGTKAIAAGDSIEKVREVFCDALAKKSEAIGPGSNGQRPDVVPVEDERDKRVTGITAALLHRAGISDLIRKGAKKRPNFIALQNVELDPGEFRGMSLLEHARESLERNKPGSSRGRSKMEVVGDFFNLAGAQTTSDFATALEEALHKTLLAAYAISPDKWTRICKIGTVSDFRVHNRYRLGFLGGLDVVLENGEFENKSLADATKETQQAKTYGNILALSRQAIINDDMGVFNGVAATLGRAAGLSIELAFFALLAENSGFGPDMNDGKALFHVDHNNIGAGAAISVVAIEADRVIMAAQTDQSGNEILDLKPAKLLLAAGLGGTARVINQAQYDPDTANKLQRPNMVLGLFDDIIDTGRLSGTRRYMFADPAVAPVIEVAFLEGEQEPFMEMQDGWRVDGVEWKVRHDFGVAAIDYRGALTDAGA